MCLSALYRVSGSLVEDDEPDGEPEVVPEDVGADEVSAGGGLMSKLPARFDVCGAGDPPGAEVGGGVLLPPPACAAPTAAVAPAGLAVVEAPL